MRFVSPQRLPFPSSPCCSTDEQRPAALCGRPDPNITIWIVEDDDEFREILGDSLARDGRTIRLFHDGRDALEAIPEGAFDILITDLVMPGSDGLHLLNEVKRLHPDRVVVMMTGYASIDSTIQAIRGGAHDYIRKPFKLEELEIVIRKASEKILLVRENKALAGMLTELMGQMHRMRSMWDGLRAETSRDERLSEMDLILRQLNPARPDQDARTTDLGPVVFPMLEKLVQFRRDGLIDEEEFLAFKKMLLERP
jgi:DNA-binding response OmpR family regulator